MFKRKLSFLPIVYPKARAMGITTFPYYEYDSNYNITYCENKNGKWYRQELDYNGKVTYFVNSYGYWYRVEYDSNGNEIYFEDSDGLIQRH